MPREEPAAETGDGAAPAAGSSPLPAGMARRGGRGLAAEGKEARAGKSGLFLAAVSLLTLDNPVPQFTPAQQPACSGGRRRAASPGRGGGGSKVTPKPAAGALQGKATNPSCISPCPAGLPLQGRANAARTPRSCRRRFPRMRKEIRMRRKACLSLIKGDTQPAVPPPPRTRTRLPSPKGNFQPLGRGSAAPGARLPELPQLQPLPSGRSRPTPPSACGGRMRRALPAPPGSGG